MNEKPQAEDGTKKPSRQEIIDGAIRHTYRRQFSELVSDLMEAQVALQVMTAELEQKDAELQRYKTAEQALKERAATQPKPDAEPTKPDMPAPEVAAAAARNGGKSPAARP